MTGNVRRPLALLTPSVVVRRAPDGIVLEASTPLPAHASTICEWLDRWSRDAPERPFLAARTGDRPWRRMSYGEAHGLVPRVAALLLERGAGPGRPVLVLSDNSIGHALVTMAALHAGAPVVPVSSAYSLASTTFKRLEHIAQIVDPSVVYVEERAPFDRALQALGLPSRAVLDASDLERGTAAASRAAIAPETVAKILFTSGSTGDPKGVVNTHAMLTANQESLRTCWPFLEAEPPVVVDWLPWSHTFGGNHNFHLVLRNGGTLYIDRGRPAPNLIDVTLRNMADVGPTLWFNVPRGFDQAVGALEQAPALAAAVFRNLRVLFYAAAALGPTTRARLEAVAHAAGNDDLFFTSAWGSTETSPLATSAHFSTRTTGVLGVPVPGVRLKLARVNDRHELRVKGPNVTPGYWQRGGGIVPPPLDAEGFLPTGDAGRLVEEERPEEGVLFAGRISENFKLSTGTWVNVGAVRLALVEACAPLVADAVIAGHDREHLAALLVLAPGKADGMLASEIRTRLGSALAAHNQRRPASSERIVRAVVLARPLSLDDGETTDKGYTNQRRVLDLRAADVERLFAVSCDETVIVAP
jgi:feruloyl-CoA synthase